VSELRVALVGPFPPPYGGMAAYFSTLETELRNTGVDCERIEVEHGPPLTRLFSFLRAAARIRRSRASVVHCITGSQPNLVANGVLLLAARGRSVLSIVGGDFAGATMRGTWRHLIRMVVSRATRIVACNREIEAALLDLGIPAERILVLSNALPLAGGPTHGISPDQFERFASQRHPLLISVSGWYEHYGSADLLRALSELRNRYPSIGLTLIVKEGGDATFASSMRAWIDEQGLRDHVLVLTNVASVTELMGRSDVFVRTPHVEGDSISVREALAVGLPVVASDAGFRPDGVVLYHPGDPVDLARALDSILSSPKPRVADTLDHEGQANLRSLLDLYRRISTP
jgi:glycosyltransferase involved in cell wall biosynthesis